LLPAQDFLHTRILKYLTLKVKHLLAGRRLTQDLQAEAIFDRRTGELEQFREDFVSRHESTIIDPFLRQ
jgi:hypothetical protein